MLTTLKEALNTTTSWISDDFWTLLQVGMATLFIGLVVAFMCLAQGCDAPPECCDGRQLCGPDYDYTACNATLIPVPVPFETTAPSDAGVSEEDACIPTDTPPTCNEYCLTPFGKCVSECVKTAGANKFGACVRLCRKQNA